MDGGLNKTATALIAVFVLTFLLFVAQILYVLSRRRHQHAGGKLKEKCVYLFCWRNQSRIEPKEIASQIHDESEAAVETTAADGELEKWRELCGPSRMLFTIKEEEEREGIEPPSSNPDADEDTTPFHTPCASPPYFTPSPSPTRDAGDLLADRACPDDIRTTPFLAIEIKSVSIDLS